MYGVVRKSYPPSYLSSNFEIILLISGRKWCTGSCSMFGLWKISLNVIAQRASPEMFSTKVSGKKHIWKKYITSLSLLYLKWLSCNCSRLNIFIYTVFPFSQLVATVMICILVSTDFWIKFNSRKTCCNWSFTHFCLQNFPRWWQWWIPRYIVAY